MSKELVELMRPLFQHGNGPHRLGKILRILHKARYDKLQLQYYSRINEVMSERSISKQMQPNKIYPQFSDFNDKMQYNGYIPHSNYISYMYCSYISHLRPFMDQHTSMLNGEILKGDHSFKIIKHMGKINGVSMFNGLYTLLNEYEEIRLQVLAPSKALTHLEAPFNNMMQSYDKFGFDKPKLFYTDNVRNDQKFLEQVIPSLSQNVQHVAASQIEQEENYLSSTLPVVKLPNNVAVHVLVDIENINEVCQQLINIADCLTDGIHVGFDCEWVLHSTVSLVQICYDTNVYLFRLCKVSSDTFPIYLAQILNHKKITKVGRNVDADLKKLETQFGKVYQNTLDLAGYCRERSAVDISSPSLAKLCEDTLGVYLPKIRRIRCGNWEADTLTQEQIQYAAIDAWVSLEIFKKTKDLPIVNLKITENTPENTFVGLYSSSKYTATSSAFGYLCSNDTTLLSLNIRKADGSKIFIDPLFNPKHMAIVKVIDVSVSALLLSCYSKKLDNGSNVKHDVTIGEICTPSDLPVYVAVHKKNIRTASEIMYHKSKDKKKLEDSRAIQIAEDTNIQDHNVSPLNTSNISIPSRVLKDAFHVMDMIKIPLTHGMSKDFMRRFRDILFVVDLEDKQNIEQYLETKNTTWDECMLENPDFIMKRTRRYIPPPTELVTALEKLFSTYGPLKCASSGMPLFDTAAVKISKNIVELARLGHISDLVDGPPLYTKIGVDKNGLNLYRCSRGTSSIEGGVHANIIRKFTSYSAGPKLTDMMLADYRLYHNLDTGSRNRYGKQYQSHYCPWISETINLLRFKVGHPVIDNYYCNLLGSSFEYQKTNETFGIVNIPIYVMRSLNMTPSSMEIETVRSRNLMLISILPLIKIPSIGYSQCSSMYKFLAQSQGTLYAVTAVHTNEEINLYDYIIKNRRDDVYTSSEKDSPDFNLFARIWSEYCTERTSVFYKTPEHISSYYNKMEDRKKYFETVKQNYDVSKDIRILAQSPSRYSKSIPFLPQPQPPSIAEQLTLEALSPKKNPMLLLPRSTPKDSTIPGKKVRTCLLCSIQGCSGRGGIVYCQFKCGKCKLPDCPGRHKGPLCLNRP